MKYGCQSFVVVIFVSCVVSWFIFLMLCLFVQRFLLYIIFVSCSVCVAVIVLHHEIWLQGLKGIICCSFFVFFFFCIFLFSSSASFSENDYNKDRDDDQNDVCVVVCLFRFYRMLRLHLVFRERSWFHFEFFVCFRLFCFALKELKVMKRRHIDYFYRIEGFKSRE